MSGYGPCPYGPHAFCEWNLGHCGDHSVKEQVESAAKSFKAEKPTLRHRLGFALGKAVDRWCVRGYGYGFFRNGFAAGYEDRHDKAQTRKVY